jgi:hypothetical protein
MIKDIRIANIGGARYGECAFTPWNIGLNTFKQKRFSRTAKAQTVS